MAREKKKIPVGSEAGQLTGNPFGGMDLGELPEGPADGPAAALGVAVVTGRVVLRREKSRRGGKTVVVVGGFDERIPDGRLVELARMARQSCGCGGTVRGREVELQGDLPDRVREFFAEQGFRVAGVS
jgi:translation initiation factor 1